jgi:hypothetical protein
MKSTRRMDDVPMILTATIKPYSSPEIVNDVA